MQVYLYLLIIKLKLVGYFTHPVFASLDHPLFAARKEGWDFFFSPGLCFARPPSLRCAERGLGFLLLTLFAQQGRASRYYRDGVSY
jgi:hypothetical protein